MGLQKKGLVFSPFSLAVFSTQNKNLQLKTCVHRLRKFTMLTFDKAEAREGHKLKHTFFATSFYYPSMESHSNTFAKYKQQKHKVFLFVLETIIQN